MIPTAFDYHRATSVEDAIRKLRDTGGKLLAGGHSLVPLMKLRLSEPTALIDITRIPGLSGIRDMSLIQTPPRDRIPVVTAVSPFDEELAREAIRRELDRGGQVFFIHNRVETIDEVAQLVRRLVPEAPDFIRGYCRVVTALWVVFFLASAAAIAWLAFAGSGAAWLAATSRDVWIAMIALSALEFFVRKTWFRYYFHGGPFDRLWSRLFPAERTSRGRRSQRYIEAYRARTQGSGRPTA